MAEGAKMFALAAKLGGFRKVTFDSANLRAKRDADGELVVEKSYPVLEFYGVKHLLDVVHYTHSIGGRETYLSGGLGAHHVPAIMPTTVDACGVGGGIHHPTPPGKSGFEPGRMVPGKVHAWLAMRDRAEQTLMGHASRLLHRLDEKYGGDGTRTAITLTENALRKKTYAAMRALTEELHDVVAALGLQRDAGTLVGQAFADRLVEASWAVIRKPEHEARFEALLAEADAIGVFVPSGTNDPSTVPPDGAAAAGEVV
jgi:hypothetical protein